MNPFPFDFRITDFVEWSDGHPFIENIHTGGLL